MSTRIASDEQVTVASLRNQDRIPAPPIGNSRSRLLLLLAVFVVSRGVYWLAGVRFNSTEIWGSFQLLPPDLLQHHLLQSLYYLHTQPPGFNLLVGLGLKVDGGHIWPLNVLYLLMGAAIVYGIDMLLRLFGVRPRTALIITAVFVVSPSVVLFENYLFYDYPLLLCVLGSVVAAGVFLQKGSTWALIACAVSLTGAALLRPVFHPVAIIAAFALLVLVAGGATVPKRTWLAVAVVLLLPVVLLAKNAVLFGQPTFSSWMGWNVGHLTTYAMPAATRRHLVAEGRLSTVALVKPFSPLREYQSIPGLACRPRRGDPPALTRFTKAVDDQRNTVGASVPNLNNRCYLEIYDKAMHDAVAAFFAAPGTYVTAEAKGYFIYGLTPASDYDRLGRVNLHDARWERTTEDVVLLTWMSPLSRNGALKHLSPVIALGYTLALLGFFIALRRFWRNRAGSSSIDRLALWTGAVLVYGIVASYGFDVHENMRFRLPFDPLAIALAIYALRAIAAEFNAPPEPDIDLTADDPAILAPST